MGEIKSTLDLVMEKTMHLSMSDQEKQAQRTLEMKNRLRGLLQKYQDGLMNGREFEQQWHTLAGEEVGSHTGLLIRELTARMDPQGENRLWFDLLQNLCRADTRHLTRLLDECGASIAALTGTREKENLKMLAEEGIRGSAVVPNPESDTELIAGIKRLESDFKEAVSQMAGDLAEDSREKPM